jgi:hypothetical protein
VGRFWPSPPDGRHRPRLGDSRWMLSRTLRPAVRSAGQGPSITLEWQAAERRGVGRRRWVVSARKRGWRRTQIGSGPLPRSTMRERCCPRMLRRRRSDPGANLLHPPDEQVLALRAGRNVEYQRHPSPEVANLGSAGYAARRKGAEPIGWPAETAPRSLGQECDGGDLPGQSDEDLGAAGEQHLP